MRTLKQVWCLSSVGDSSQQCWDEHSCSLSKFSVFTQILFAVIIVYWFVSFLYNKSFLYLLDIYGCFACMYWLYACAPFMCLVLSELRRHQILWNCSCGWLWVPRTKPRSSQEHQVLLTVELSLQHPSKCSWFINWGLPYFSILEGESLRILLCPWWPGSLRLPACDTLHCWDYRCALIPLFY